MNFIIKSKNFSIYNAKKILVCHEKSCNGIIPSETDMFPDIELPK